MIPDTIETVAPLEHTKLGIASCVVAVLVFVYFFVAGYISLYGLDAFMKDSYFLGALGVLILALFVHLIVCSVGFIVGLALGIGSLIQTKRKRLFGIVGVTLNALPLVAALGFLIYFVALVKN